jgi:bifunctional UDP-N-acetylglucosamine pyrophosphorylase/glucosamine-1-phosphate N-acetyltransferase
VEREPAAEILSVARDLKLMPKPRKIPNASTETEPTVAIAIMAAGKGTRLKSRHPKVLHQVGGKPMLAYVVAAALRVAPAADVYAIVGHEAERVRDAVSGMGITFVVQEPQRGTGHALMVARDALTKYDHVIVLSGDAPLIWWQTIDKLRDFHLAQKAAMTVLTAEVPDPQGYGRIVRRRTGSVEVRAIVEENKLTPAERELREINSGIYVFAVKPLYRYIDRLGTDNPHKEYYLTDMAALLVKASERVVATTASDPHEVLGSNTRAELAALDARLRAWKCADLMQQGVTIYYPHTCVIDMEVEIGADTVIEPYVQLLGRTRVGADCRVQSHSVISDCELGDGVWIKPGCVLETSRIRSRAQLGPYTHLRQGCDIGEEVHMGNFVEAKKAKLGRGSKANHLTYLGDAVLGQNVNVGAGTITCNFDGERKHQTVIEDGAFIGSDSTLVAPVRIGKDAYVAAGSSITEDVPAEALGIARGRQTNKEGWVRQRAKVAKKEGS